MKKIIIICLTLMAPICLFALKNEPGYLAARRFGAQTSIRICVKDDLGSIVQGAAVSVFMGMNFRTDGYYVRGETDENGVFIAEGKTCGDEIEIKVSKEGYYSSKKTLCFIKKGLEHDVVEGKWQPFCNEERMILRQVGAPESLIVVDKIVDVVQTNMWMGFDMKKVDFVGPNGRGVYADFEVKAEWDGLPAWESRHCGATIRFHQEMCGGYNAARVMESEFPYPFRAETTNGFENKSIAVVERNPDLEGAHIQFGGDASFVFRTRCIEDNDGTLKSANYGCIRRFEVGPSRRGVVLMRLSYVFNPTPNDTNLEDEEIANRSRQFIRRCEPLRQ